MTCQVLIKDISPRFAGWNASAEYHTYFNMRSTLAQLGVNGAGRDIVFDEEARSCALTVELTALSPLGVLMLDEIKVNSRIGKLFCRDTTRRVATPEYLRRLVGRVDRLGAPLLHLGTEGEDWWCEVRDNRAIFHIRLRQGCVNCDGDVASIVPLVGKALCGDKPCKSLLRLYQSHNYDQSRTAVPGKMLMVRTGPLFIRSCYGRVASDLLPKGLQCATSDLLEPVTGEAATKDEMTGRTFCFFGNMDGGTYLESIPLEFYKLEAWREHLYFDDRLQGALDAAPELIFNAFDTIADAPRANQSCCYLVKPEQFRALRACDWITTVPVKREYPGIRNPAEQRRAVRAYIHQQCSYGILKALSLGDINSHGVLCCKYLPSPVLKNLLLSDTVSACIKRIYFEKCSSTSGSFLSHEDRSLLYDLTLFGVEVVNVDIEQRRLFKYCHKKGRDHGAFVPIYPVDKVEDYLNATSFGVYGSNLLEGNLEGELEVLLAGMLAMKRTVDSPLMNAQKPLALITGGGPGAMEVGNRVAKKLGLLSCGNICDFSRPGQVVNEQKRNKYVDVWMTYRLEKLVERQSDFQLDFPIFLMGGIGTDFEYALEEVRRKVGTTPPQPVLLFGTVDYWTQKLTHRFHRNVKEGVIKGSEWVSNCFYVVQTGAQGVAVYQKWFGGELVTGPAGKQHDGGFCIVPEDVATWKP
eukprot:TRINITY_DN361_c0_g1_i1.p1 TRINITY_DN361_c0_g1~~TRINITY_DN361_c0_g1_i1.p1  ORF type:complete len:786 (+),score=283.10 TRINITY_DN361_c0_g1_i1:278-2359(+)